MDRAKCMYSGNIHNRCTKCMCFELHIQIEPGECV